MYQFGGSKDTPTIILDETTNVFSIHGASFAENPTSVYNPVLEWVDTHLPLIENELKCEFDFHYLNSSSKRAAYEVMKKLEGYLSIGKKITVLWYFDRFDDDMLEQGQEYNDILDLPFKFLPK